MKILLLTTHLNIGGIGCYTLSLAKSLKKRGHSILVVSSGGDLVGELNREEIVHLKIDINTKSELSPKVFLAVIRLRSIVKRQEIELIHAQSRVTQVVTAAVARGSRVSFVSTCHGFFKPRWGRKVFGCWGDKVIAISEAVREHLVNDLRVKKGSVALVHNGVDIEKFSRFYSEEEKERFRAEAGLGNGLIVGIIARLSPVKGHKYLLAAMREVVNLKPDVQLLIVGEGPCQKELLSQTQLLGLKNNVVFLDATFDTTKLLSVMDIFALPSLQEGLGLSIMEAQAAGIPVVASNVGGIYTIIKDDQSGLLLPPGDSASLAEAILKLMDNPGRAKEMGEKGREVIRERFSLDKMARDIEGVYKQCVEA